MTSISDPSMDAVSESHTNFGKRFQRQKLIPFSRIVPAAAAAPEAADLVC